MTSRFAAQEHWFVFLDIGANLGDSLDDADLGPTAVWTKVVAARTGATVLRLPMRWR